MKMYNPPHPGEILKELYLEPLGLTITSVAKGLGVTRKTLSELINKKYGIALCQSLFNHARILVKLTKTI